MKIKLSSNNLFQYLVDVGICQKQDIESTIITPKCSKSSRNNFTSLHIKMLNGRRLVVKQQHLDGDAVTTDKIKNERSLCMFLQSCADLSYTSSLNSKIIHFDDKNSIIIYILPKDFRNLGNYYKVNTNFPIAIAELVGTTLAIMHFESVRSSKCYDFMNKNIEGKLYYQFPYPDYLLDRLEPETLLQEFPPEGNNFIYFYQHSKGLRAAVTELVVQHNHYCLTHNNPQLNNIFIPTHWDKLLSQTNQSNQITIKIINWESCSWGDPAFDLGTVLAGYLLLWLRSLIMHPAITLNQSLQLAIIPLESIQPSSAALIISYLNNFNIIFAEYPDFVNRVVQFTGLALVYKIIESIQSFNGFNMQDIYILQVAKNLLCRPEKSFESVFGMTRTVLINQVSF